MGEMMMGEMRRCLPSATNVTHPRLQNVIFVKDPSSEKLNALLGAEIMWPPRNSRFNGRLSDRRVV
jgi:hypothetical protein